MSDLPDDVIALRTGLFLNPKATLTMHNVQSVFTDRAAAAMKALVDGGFVTATTNQFGAVTYSLTEAGVELPKKSLKWMGKNGSFPIAQKKEPPR